MTRTTKQARDNAPLPDSKLKLRLWLRLLRTSRAIEIELRERLRVTFSITLPQFDVLAALARSPSGMTMSELSRFLMVSNGNVTGIIDRLVTDGKVIRMVKEGDRRATFVCLTRDGASHFEIMAAAHEAWVAELLASLSRDDCHALTGLLNRVPQDVTTGEQS
jgi:DNA-binding MarR family transcriptional regulator